MSSILFWLVAVPVLGSLICIPLSDRYARWAALATGVVGVVLAGLLYAAFDPAQADRFQLAVEFPWIPAFGIRFALGVDALNFPLVLLSKLVLPVALLASWGEQRHARAFMICYLALDAAMVGCLLATDIFLFYVLWEAMLIPMLLLIGVWGSKERVYAAVKFFLFTFAGSVLMLAAVLWVFVEHHAQIGAYTGDIAALGSVVLSTTPVLYGLSPMDLVFLGFTLAFAVKVPLFPLHTWLPDAHVQAPTGGSILLAAVLLKLGTYGLLRFSIPYAPLAFLKFQGALSVLSVIGIVYGAWVALAQTDMKRLIAYSSVSHLGFVVLGICALNTDGLTGAVLQMVNHGLSTGALFLLVGILYERRHSRELADLGGLAEFMPKYAVFLVFIACSSMAVPGLNGFVGEFLVLRGVFQASPLFGVVAVTGVVFGALYLLVMLRAVLFGPTASSENRALSDLSLRDWAALVPLCIFIVWLGIAPGALLSRLGGSLDGYWRKAVPSLSIGADVPLREGGRS